MTRSYLNVLLLFVPITLGLHYVWPERELLIFCAACLAIIPLAGWLGEATEHLAGKTSEAIGGLLNATFGNAAELIIAFMALRAGLPEIVKASLSGSIIGNLLFVTGASYIAGGIKYETQHFNEVGARSQAGMLILACIGMIAPSVYQWLAFEAGEKPTNTLSLEISLVLLVTYGFSLLFSLVTHKHLFSGTLADNGEKANSHGHHHRNWSMKRSLLVLVGSTALVAWMSEILVGTVEHTAQALGMTNIFVGVIIVAIIGNVAEHSSAVVMARKNKMDLSLGIAIGSSTQIALFVAPLLVLCSYFVGPHPIDLVFQPSELVAIISAVVICAQTASDGKSNWFEGVQLLSVYLIWALLFYFLPVAVMP